MPGQPLFAKIRLPANTAQIPVPGFLVGKHRIAVIFPKYVVSGRREYQAAVPDIVRTIAVVGQRDDNGIFPGQYPDSPLGSAAGFGVLQHSAAFRRQLAQPGPFQFVIQRNRGIIELEAVGFDDALLFVNAADKEPVFAGGHTTGGDKVIAKPGAGEKPCQFLSNPPRQVGRGFDGLLR